jgi:phospholipase/carboxylesterase
VKEEIVEIGGLRAISIGSREGADFVVVLLHGFMMVPADLSPFAQSIGLNGWFLYPEGIVPAPPGRAWWHIDPDARAAAIARGPRDFAEQNPPDLPEARRRLTAFLDALTPLAAGRPLIVGGFSQGGMLVCDTLLRTQRKVDGLVLLSTSRVAFSEWGPYLGTGSCFRGVPALISHGETDPDLAFTTGEALRDALTREGAEVEWVPFPQGHEIPLLVWRRLRKFLQARSSTHRGGGRTFDR